MLLRFFRRREKWALAAHLIEVKKMSGVELTAFLKSHGVRSVTQHGLGAGVK